MKILFLTGWQAASGGIKPTFLREHGHEVIEPDLDDDNFSVAVQTAQQAYNEGPPDVVLGLSRGGAVAMNIDIGKTPLVLMCPGWKRWGKAKTVGKNTMILHSRADDLVPFTFSEELITNSGLSPKALIETGNDHFLSDPEPLQAMLEACERIGSTSESLLDHPAISGRYLFPQQRFVDDSFLVEVDGAELACYRKTIDPDSFTMVHFHGNGEAVADYVPDMADVFAGFGLNSLFVEYREYGRSTGKAQLVVMLGDGEAAMKAAGLEPGKVIVFGRSIGSLYAIELVHRQPAIAGLILESSIADPSERFLTYADLSAAGITESDVLAEAEQHFNHQRKLSEYKNPLLILHTENDGLVDISHAQRNYQWAGSRQKRFLRFPIGNHNTIFGMNLQEYLAAVGDFAGAL